jgi:hypothetical protein
MVIPAVLTLLIALYVLVVVFSVSPFFKPSWLAVSSNHCACVPIAVVLLCPVHAYNILCCGPAAGFTLSISSFKQQIKILVGHHDGLLI